MASVTVTLDRDVEARVKRYADGIGVPLEEVLEKALCFALKTRYDAAQNPDPGYGVDQGGRPDNSLPGSGARPDQGLPESPTHKPGSPAGRPDQLPAGGRRRCPVFDASVDNELPEGEVPEVDNELPETAEPKE